MYLIFSRDNLNMKLIFCLIFILMIGFLLNYNFIIFLLASLSILGQALGTSGILKHSHLLAPNAFNKSAFTRIYHAKIDSLRKSTETQISQKITSFT